MKSNWRQTHGDEYEVPALVTDNFRDESYRGDQCPRFERKDDTEGRLSLWVEHPTIAKRCCEWVPRYLVVREYVQTECNVSLCETDDVEAAVKCMLEATL